jgi:hypothetical protein
MKQQILKVGLIILLFWMTDVCVYGKTTCMTGLRYDRFEDDLTSTTTGTELTIPLRLTYERDEMLVLLETAYSRAKVEPEGDAAARLSGFTDTHLAMSYMFPKWPVGIRLGLDVNFPTGKEQLDLQQRHAEVGERNDLFEVDNFGEGLNIGLSLGLVQEIRNVSLVFNGTYILNGKFDSTSDIPDDELDPGDQLVLLVLLNWQASTQFTFDIFGAYSHFAEDHLNGHPNFRRGDKWAFGSRLLFVHKAMEIAFKVQEVIQGKNEILQDQNLQPEPANGNGSEFFGEGDVLYHVSSKLAFRLGAALGQGSSMC